MSPGPEVLKGDQNWYGFLMGNLQVCVSLDQITALLEKYSPGSSVLLKEGDNVEIPGILRLVRSNGSSMMKVAYEKGWLDLAAAFIWLPKEIAGPLYNCTPENN